MRKMKNRLKFIFMVLLVFGILEWGPVASSVAKARAGGGQHYSGSGSSGGGSSGSGSSRRHSSSSYSGSSGSSRRRGTSSGGSPCVVLFVIAIIVIVVLAGRKKKGASATAAAPSFLPPPPPPATVDPQLLGRQIADLKARDPEFSEQAFEDMASTAFFKIQEAWASRNMPAARSFLSPTVFQRFETQIAELERNRQTNKMENLVIGSLELVETVHDGGFDYVTVRINAAAADYTVDDDSGRIVSGSREVRPFTEYWTFLRSDQVKTQVGREIVSQSCPNCGAPIKLNAVGKCEYCGSDVTSGQFSWVLCEITQEGVWRPRASSAARPDNVSPLAAGRYVLGLVQCPQCGAAVQDLAGVTTERCWRCGAVVPTQR